MDTKTDGLTIVVAILVLANAYFFISAPVESSNVSGSASDEQQAFILPPNQVSYLPLLDTTEKEVNLDAKSAILYDVKSDRDLFEKDIHAKLPIASLTKILNATVVWETFSPNDIVTVQASAVKVDSQRQDVFEGETLSVNTLMQMMLVESSNDAAYALRDYAQTKGIDLVKQMNAKAASLDMRDTKFVDAAGLNDDGYSTVSDMVKAVSYALRYDAIWNFSRESTATVVSADGKFTRDIKSTNELLGVLSDIVGGKTGYTDSALGCMILIVDVPGQNDRMIAVLLGSHDRFGDMKNLITWAKKAYRWN